MEMARLFACAANEQIDRAYLVREISYPRDHLVFGVETVRAAVLRSHRLAPKLECDLITGACRDRGNSSDRNKKTSSALQLL